MKDNMKNRKHAKSSSRQKHVIITGGGSGLGFGLATRYLKQGASVTILDLSITDEQQNTLAESAKNNHAGCLFLTTNITVAEEVKQSNFTVLKNAQRVYQAKETINFNKRNLLPRLNLWNVLKTPFSWKGALDIVQDIAPFLVPGNWFKVGQSKKFYFAYQEQYRALWANEVMTAKLLYINTLRDIDFLNTLKAQSMKIEELVGIAETRQIFGSVEPRTTRFLKIKSLEVKEDI